MYVSMYPCMVNSDKQERSRIVQFKLDIKLLDVKTSFVFLHHVKHSVSLVGYIHILSLKFIKFAVQICTSLN